MATILQQPDQYSFAGNIKNIIVSTEVRIIFKLKHGTEVLFESSYDPDLNDKVEIDIKKIVQDTLSSSVPGIGEIITRDFPLFSFSIDTEAEISFYAFDGGIDSTISSSWFAENFLTWQPQTSYVTWNQPQFLSYIALQSCILKIKGYFSDDTNQIVIFGDFTINKINIANLQFSTLPTKFANKQPQYIDIWTENAQGARLSYIQRFVLKNSTTDDNSFLFKNSLGGWDSVVFNGLIKNEGASDVKTYAQEDTANEYQVDLIEKYSKNTGYFLSDKHRIWIAEFFKTSERYFLSHRSVFEKITVLSSSLNSQKGNPSSYSFAFSLSRTTKYLNLSRVDIPEAPLEIVDPAGELFFLAPRLVEFPSYSDDDGLIPIQSPYIQSWFKISKTQLKSEIKQSIMIDPAFSQYVLPKASDTVLGGIKVGSNLSIDPDGTLHAQNSYSLPVATIASLGGVMIGSNISVSAQGVISVAAPYVHPDSHPASMIVSDTLRRFITDTQISNYDTAYNARHTHGNKSNLDTINQGLSKTSNVQFNNIIADSSIAFYGDVGSGSVPVGSLLDLSDIDPSLATAITGSPLVKLASGKWGPGNILIDLSNYFNKTDSDSRFAFKSHSHDYVSPTTFNSHTGDTVKHLTAAERTAWNGKEPALGNPDVDGKILSSSGGVRSWVNRYVLPVAAAAMLGGVMIGSNISVNAQGVISVAAPYSHPASHAASMIDTDATRRFISDAQLSNLADAYNLRHSHGNKANLDSINQDLSQTSNVKFNNLIADGSIGFYGGVGSGITPVASLLDLSDIDASISTAATGTPLVKLSNGKWGAGSISIDLSNYFNKTDADARYAFKSHSHDYISPTTFNGHTGDNIKHITGTERTNWNAAYGWGNHANGGYVTKSNVIYSDLNGLYDSGFYYLNGATGMNSPVGYIEGNILHLTYNNTTTYNAQLFVSHSSPSHIFFRKQYSGTWLGWKEFYHSGNIDTIKSDLALGSNAYTSTAFLPLTGGILSGALVMPSFDRGFEVNYSGGISFFLDEINAGALGGTGSLYLGNRRTNQVYVRGANVVIGADNIEAYAIRNQNSAAQTGTLWINGVIRSNAFFQLGTTTTMFMGVGGDITGGLTSSDLLLYNTGGNLNLWATGGVGLTIAASTGLATFSSSVSALNFKIGNNYYRTNNSYLELQTAGDEICIGGSATNMYINYRAATGGTPTGWIWMNGVGGYASFDVGGLYAHGRIYSSSYIEAASYLKGTSVKLGTWEIKENASGELEFIQSGTLRFKGTSLGLVSQKTVAFYD